MKKNITKSTTFRIFFVAAVFLAVCVIYSVRMVNIIATADPDDKIVTGNYIRREPIQALRGEIYDRNGNVLVYNEYSYDMVFDYDAMAATQLERNYTILEAVSAVKATGNSSHLTETSFPFKGTYPNYTYTDEAIDGDSNIYYRLLKRIAENELETDSGVSKTELTVAQLDAFYKEHPEEFPTEAEIVDWYLTRYKISETDEVGDLLFSDSEIDKIIRVRYDMEVADFSVYNRYTFATDVDIEFMTYVKELHIVGADFEIETERKYAYPGYASHVLGRIGPITSESWEYYKALGYDMDDMVGIDGCESAFEDYLRGVDGVRVVVEDKNGRIIESYVEKEPISGKDIYLTIDIELQIVAEDSLAENVELYNDSQAGAITAIDPKTGEVLVLASYPTYDLSKFSEDYAGIASDPRSPELNRAINAYAPGSVFKVGMVAASITEGVVDSDTTFYCDGLYTEHNFNAACWIHASGGKHYWVNAVDALKWSCNCYFYELGPFHLGIENMNKYCVAFGLGSATGIEIDEKIGRLATPEYKESRGETWNPIDTAQAAIGQSDNQFSPLQISNYIATVLNGGDRYSVHLLLEVREYGAEEPIYKTKVEQVDEIRLSTAAVQTAMDGMKAMVEDDRTAKGNMEGIPVTVGGKTGTAQRDGKNDNRFFVCAAPYNDPEIIVTVFIQPDDSKPKDNVHGSAYASYAASEVLKEYYAKK